MKIQFLGATGTVTGSRYLVTTSRTKVLVDCGLFQGFKNLRLKNWEPFPFPVSEIDAVLLTHAHLDHSGSIPLLAKSGYKGPIYCTQATLDLCRILLPDSGFLQEEEARFANKGRFSKHTPALPLYTQKDAERALHSFIAVDWRKKYAAPTQHGSDLEFEFHPAGHLLGAATILLKSQGRSLAFSGDIGRANDPLTRPPAFDVGADALVIESTYGNRSHPTTAPQEELREIIAKTFERRGVLLIPSFAVGRAQQVLYYIRKLQNEGAIPEQPVFLNSPMALNANDIFCRHATAESKLSSEEARRVCATAKAISSVEESKELNTRSGPMIIIAASGMATGGRVLHHIKSFAPDPRNTILFVGFQAGGTRGDTLIKGAQEVKIHGEYWPIRAEIAHMDSLSAHADREGLLSWVSGLKKKPDRIFITHGEPDAADHLRRALSEKLGIDALVPDYQQSIDLNMPIHIHK